MHMHAGAQGSVPAPAGHALAFGIFATCYEGQPGALLRGYAELLSPESNCAVDVRAASLQGAPGSHPHVALILLIVMLPDVPSACKCIKEC